LANVEGKLLQLVLQLADFARSTEHRFEASEQRDERLQRGLAGFTDAVDPRLSSLEATVAGTNLGLSATNRALAGLTDAVGPHLSSLEAAAGETNQGLTTTNRVLAGFMEAVDRRFERLETAVGETNQGLTATNRVLAGFMEAVDRRLGATAGEANQGLTATNRVLAGFTEAVDRRFEHLEVALVEISRNVNSLSRSLDGFAHSVNWLVQEGVPRLSGMGEKIADDVMTLMLDTRHVRAGVGELKNDIGAVKTEIEDVKGDVAALKADVSLHNARTAAIEVLRDLAAPIAPGPTLNPPAPAAGAPSTPNPAPSTPNPAPIVPGRGLPDATL
jgi:ABC-type transporter Mla subunit MlaD